MRVAKEQQAYEALETSWAWFSVPYDDFALVTAALAKRPPAIGMIESACVGALRV